MWVCAGLDPEDRNVELVECKTMRYSNAVQLLFHVASFHAVLAQDSATEATLPDEPVRICQIVEGSCKDLSYKFTPGSTAKAGSTS